MFLFGCEKEKDASNYLDQFKTGKVNTDVVLITDSPESVRDVCNFTRVKGAEGCSAEAVLDEWMDARGMSQGYDPKLGKFVCISSYSFECCNEHEIRKCELFCLLNCLKDCLDSIKPRDSGFSSSDYSGISEVRELGRGKIGEVTLKYEHSQCLFFNQDDDAETRFHSELALYYGGRLVAEVAMEVAMGAGDDRAEINIRGSDMSDVLKLLRENGLEIRPLAVAVSTCRQVFDYATAYLIDPSGMKVSPLNE